MNNTAKTFVRKTAHERVGAQTMTEQEKRKHDRVESLNLSYICEDEKGIIVNEGMGRTLNVSESGILLETHFATVPGHYLNLTVAIEDDLVDIRGRIVHSSTGEADKYQAGIQFLDIDDHALEILKKFIRIFNATTLENRPD